MPPTVVLRAASAVRTAATSARAAAVDLATGSPLEISHRLLVLATDGVDGEKAASRARAVVLTGNVVSKLLKPLVGL